jgi:hypothetical protein
LIVPCESHAAASLPNRVVDEIDDCSAHQTPQAIDRSNVRPSGAATTDFACRCRDGIGVAVSGGEASALDESIQKPNDFKRALPIDAIIRRVDLVARELTTQADNALAVYYVPPNCDVRLRGERVKLRMIQPGDRVRVVYTIGPDALVAESIEVHPTCEKTLGSPRSKRPLP